MLNKENYRKITARTSDETLRDSLTKAKFWLAVCSNQKLETVFKGLTSRELAPAEERGSLREGLHLDNHLQRVGDHQAPASAVTQSCFGRATKAGMSCRISDPPIRKTRTVRGTVEAALARANSTLGRKGRPRSLSIFFLQAR